MQTRLKLIINNVFTYPPILVHSYSSQFTAKVVSYENKCIFSINFRLKNKRKAVNITRLVYKKSTLDIYK